MAVIQQNVNEQDENQQQQQLLTTGGGATQSAPTGQAASSAPQAPAAGGSPQQKGSGRFNNLQKYVQANEGAGQRIASGIQNKIDQTYNPYITASQKGQTQGQQNIQQGQQALTTGEQIKSEIGSESFTPDQAVSYASDANKLAELTKQRTGQAIDNQALQQQNIAFQQANIASQEKAQERQKQLQDEQGRLGLLKESYAGKYKPTYTTGQSRLDNLLLQAGGQNISGLQSEAQNKLQNVANLRNVQAQQGQTYQDLFGREAALAQGIQDQTNLNTQKFKDLLGGQVEGFNQALQSNIDAGEKYLDRYTMSDAEYAAKYGEGKSAYNQAAEMFDKFGLQRGQQSFNVFNNPDLELNQLADVEARRAQEWRDVANQQNVGQYDAFARMMGLDPNQYELTDASTINQAGYNLYGTEDERSLQGRIAEARQNLLDQAARGDLISGGTQSVGDQYATGHISLADYLKNQDYWTRAALTGSGASDNLNLLQQLGGLMQTAGNAPGDIIDNAFGTGGNIADASLAAILGPSAVLQGLGSLFGGDRGDAQQDWRYAKQRAVGHGLMDPSQGSFEGSATGQALANYLDNAGFGNYITEGGVSQATGRVSDLAKQFGYRSGAQNAETQEGYYNPMFERERILQQVGLLPQGQGQANTQVTEASGPMSAEDALAARGNEASRLTREQIAQMGATMTDADRAAIRQELISGDRYLTSNPEMQEIINKELTANNLVSPAITELINRYRATGAPTRTDQWITDLSGKSSNISRDMNQQELEQAARDYYSSRPDQLGNYQSFLNQLTSNNRQGALDRAASQIYGAGLDESLIGNQSSLTTQQILDSLYRAPAPQRNWADDLANMFKGGL